MSPEASAPQDLLRMESRAPQHGLLCCELSALGGRLEEGAGRALSLRDHPRGRSILYCGLLFVT